MSAFDIVKHFPNPEWLCQTAQKIDDKMRFAVQKAQAVDFIPYTTTKDGEWVRRWLSF